MSSSRKSKIPILKKAAPARVVVVAPSSSAASSPKKKKQRGKKKPLAHARASASNILTRYMQTLQDPWRCGPVRLGWGTFMPTSLRTAYVKLIYSPPAANVYTTIKCNPLYFGAPSSNSTNGFMNILSNAGPTTSYSSYAAGAGSGATNAAQLLAAITGGRLVSAALRAIVRYPATGVRPQVVGVAVPDDGPIPFTTTSYDSLTKLNASRWAHATATGECGVEVQYRPADPASFNMNQQMDSQSDQSSASNLIVLVGLTPTTSVIEINLIAHYETNGGFDLSSEDSNGDDMSMSAAGVTMDEAGAIASRTEPVLTSSWAIDALEHGLTHAMSKSSFGFSGRVGPRKQGEATLGGQPGAEGPLDDYSVVQPFNGPSGASTSSPVLVGDPRTRRT